ncbi:MAG TPA: FlgD immunoglobulin-like domain containing protein [candidate division Zixibacteria bacterium]|nr:FlgD immunoglobulin-like domain containing protein [candidate division Zixibacteria bacterium]
MVSIHYRQFLVLLVLILNVACNNNPIKPDPNLGDLNLNGIHFEIADAVLYSNYFVYGKAVFTVDVQSQTAASDINVDGKQLTVADLVYFCHIVLGDALPRPKLNPLHVRYSHSPSDDIKILDNVRIGAAYVVVTGNSQPTLLIDDMEMIDAYDGNADKTRILVWSLEGNDFTNEFLDTYGEIVYMELATNEGQPTEIELINADFFHLGQNYPNPFSNRTRIPVYLPMRSFVELVITDAYGRRVYNISGEYEAGEVAFDWDAVDNSGTLLASGIYYCTATMNGKTYRIKMTLLRQ